MGSRKRSRKPQQQRLGFEPLAAAADGAASNSSPTTGVGLSPARVTFSSPTKKTQQSSFGKSVAAMTPTRRKGFDRKQQQTLEGTLGKTPTTFLLPLLDYDAVCGNRVN